MPRGIRQRVYMGQRPAEMVKPINECYGSVDWHDSFNNY